MTRLDDYAKLYGGGDPNVKGKSGDFDTFDDGEYKIKGIARWFTTDRNDPPIPVFVPDTRSGEMVARCNLLLETPTDSGSTTGPSWTGTRTDITLLVAALGGDISKLPDGETSAFLIQAQKIANDAGKVTKATVKGGKGWVRFIEGTVPPSEGYLWRFIGARGWDNKELTFQEKKETWNGKEITKDVVMLRFEIAGKPNGKPSPYNGYVIEIELRKPFADETMMLPNGKYVPSVLKGKNGGMLPSVKDYFNWLDLFWPGNLEWNWENDPEKSSYFTNELENPIWVVSGEAKKAGVLALAKLSISDGGRPYIKLEDFGKSGLDDDDLSEATVKSRVPADPAELEMLLRTCDTVAGFAVFEPTPKSSDRLNTKFSTEGKEWAGKVLGPLCDALKFPRSIRDLNQEQLRLLDAHVAAIQGKSDDEFKQYVHELANEDTF